MSSLDFLHGIETVEIDDGIRPITTAKSSIIGLIGSAGKGAVNSPALVTGDIRDGVNQFGVYGDDGFTIPEALSAIYEQIGAMCIVVNVCDPAVHFTAIVNETVTFGANSVAATVNPYISAVTLGTAIAGLVTRSSGVLALPAGTTAVTSVKSADGVTTYTLATDYTVSTNKQTITPVVGGAMIGSGAAMDGTTYLVTYAAAPVLNVDYTFNPDTGNFIRIVGGQIIPQASIKVSYTYVDPTKVMAADIIGGVGASGNRKGLQAFYDSETLWEIKPRILIAPRFTHQKANPITANPVVANMLSIANRLKAIIFADGPNTTDAAVLQYVQDWGDPRIMVVEPFVEVAGPSGNGSFIPSSAVWAGVTAAVDNNIGFWASPSNKEISGVIGVGRPIDFSMTDPNCRANYLNSVNVSVVIRSNGFRTWGNHSTSVDPKWTFLCVRRTADIIEDSIAASTLWAIDRVIGAAFFTEVAESVNGYMNYLKSLGAIYGGHCWVDRSLNNNQVIASGQAYFDYDFTAPFPAEHITFRAHLVDDYIGSIFASIAANLVTNVSNADVSLSSSAATSALTVTS